MTVGWEPSIITPGPTIDIQVRAVGHLDIDAGEFLSRFRLQYIDIAQCVRLTLRATVLCARPLMFAYIKLLPRVHQR